MREGLESYIETTERAAELDEKIRRTDELIDEIVYELYGLTDEEIESVEEAVGERAYAERSEAFHRRLPPVAAGPF